MKNKEIIIYVPSYGLSFEEPSKLTCMSLETAKKGIEMMKKGSGSMLVFSTAYYTWEQEAELKKKLAREYGVKDDLVKIIPGGTATTTYIEAEGLFKIVSNPDTKIIVVGQKYHVKRAAKALRYLFNNVEIVKVWTEVERILDPSWLKSVCMTRFIWYNWFFYLVTPWMMRRQMSKRKGGLM